MNKPLAILLPILALAACTPLSAGSALTGVETECAERIIVADYQSTVSLARVDSPFGFWKLEGHEVRVGKASMLEILDAREQRIDRAGLNPYGSVYLTERLHALDESAWPIDMRSLVPPSSAWDEVSRPEPVSEVYLASEFYRLSMHGLEQSILLEKVLFHGLAEVRTLDGQRLEYARRFGFKQELEDDWMAFGEVWVDFEGAQIHQTCRLESIDD